MLLATKGFQGRSKRLLSRATSSTTWKSVLRIVKEITTLKCCCTGKSMGGGHQDSCLPAPGAFRFRFDLKVSSFLQPGVLAPRQEEGLMHVTDWLPTLLEAVGLQPPIGIDGISHWKAFRDGGELTRTEMLYNFKNISDGSPIAALRQDNWKYLSHVNGFDGWNPAPEDTLQQHQNPKKDPRAHFNQLFDLASDPLEEVKLISISIFFFCSTIWPTRNQSGQH